MDKEKCVMDQMYMDEYAENKRVFLQLLQEPISRMSSTSAVFKGFSAAVLAGLASASFTDISLLALIIGLVPILSFFALDVYYFGIERSLRYRYKQVAKDEVKIDFIINPKLQKNEKREAKSQFFQCVKSRAIWLFHGPTIACAVALIVLKAVGVI